MSHILNYPLYIFFGTIPSIIWLNFYLRRDVRPEPKLMILKIFFYGMASTLPAIFLETAIFTEISKLHFSSLIISSLNMFVGVALVEELLKFLVVKEKVLQDPEFNEPVDAMIYMVIAALGFAAGENILILFPLKSPVLEQIVGISILRFLGATFLHTLSSAIIGFFIGLSLRPRRKIWKVIFIGLFLSILLHGFYNLYIIKLEGNLKILVPALLLIITAVFVSFGFKRLTHQNVKR